MVEQNYAPRLRQKEEELARQMGTQVKIDPASDPEFVAALRKGLADFEVRYSEVLQRVKSQIVGIVTACR